jgi:hypothetical protein
MGGRDGAEGSFALAPDHSGALAWDGAFFSFLFFSGCDPVFRIGAGIGVVEMECVLVFVPSVNLGEVSFSGCAVGEG